MEADYRDTPEGKWRFANPSLYQKTLEFQSMLAKHGIAWHNPFANECTADFCCCYGDGKYKKYFPSMDQMLKDINTEHT